MKDKIPKYSKSPVKVEQEQRSTSPAFKLPTFKLKTGIKTSPAPKKQHNKLISSKSAATFFNRTTAYD